LSLRESTRQTTCKEDMKKPVLAALGVAGACAACCAIPLAVPLLGALTAGGLASLGWGWLAGGSTMFTVMALLLGGIASGFAVWFVLRRKGVNASNAKNACATGPTAGACGCAASVRSSQ